MWGVATLSSYVLKMEGGRFSPHPDNPKSLDWANEGMIMTVKMVLGSAMKAQSMGILHPTECGGVDFEQLGYSDV